MDRDQVYLSSVTSFPVERSPLFLFLVCVLTNRLLSSARFSSVSLVSDDVSLHPR